MYCRRCGNEIEDNALFCAKCGTKVINVEEIKPAKEVKKDIIINSKEAIEANKSETPAIKKNGMISWVIFIAVAVALSIIIAIVLAPKIKVKAVYKEKLELANEYFEEMNYEKAIAYYEKAIKIDPNSVDAYLGLADVYIEMGDYDKAIEVLTDLDADFNKKEQEIIEDKIDEIEDYIKKNLGNVTVDVYNAMNSSDSYKEGISDITVQLNVGFDNNSDEIYMQATTDVNGHVSFGKIKKGQYTLVISGGDYITYSANIAVEEDMSIVKYLVSNPDAGDGIVLVEWNGNRDVDLCFFNAATKERISIGNPSDRDGSRILCDNKEAGFELVYLEEMNESKVRSIYVVDNDWGNGSSMENDGVTVSVYEYNSRKYAKQADTSKTEKIWYPFYIYEDQIYDDVDSYYNADEEGFEWAMLTKDGAENEASIFDQENEAIKAYMNFLDGNGTIYRGSDYNGGNYSIYDLIYEGENYMVSWGPYRMGYRFAYIEGAEYPAMILEKVYDEGFHADDKVVLSSSDIITYENGTLVYKRCGFEGMADEGGWCDYKNYIGFCGGYDQMGDDYGTVERLNSKYEFVEDTSVLICFDEVSDMYFDTAGWSAADFDRYYADTYKGWIVYKAGSNMTFEKHVDSLNPVELQYTERKMLN